MNTSQKLCCVALSVSAITFSSSRGWAAENHDWLLTDRYGQVSSAAADEKTPALTSVGHVQHQMPAMKKGMPVDEVTQQRMDSAYKVESLDHWVWFPSHQPPMSQNLGSIDKFGNTALKPGALLKQDPVSEADQYVKYAASDIGIDYVCHIAHVMGAVDNHAPGTESFQQYITSVFELRWNLLSGPDATGTWLNTELDSSYGVGGHRKKEDGFAGATGAACNPNHGVFFPQGSYIVELALMQSFCEGNGVMMFGVVDKTNYFDTNRYANTEYGLFLNEALCNSMVLPVTVSNLTWVMQYNLGDNWYMMLSAGTNNTGVAGNPFDDVNWENMSYLTEFGWTSPHAMGLGQGTYRIQPFISTVDGKTQPGIGLNFDQDIGHSPWAFFGRAGTAGNRVSTIRNAQAQITGGIVLKRPMSVLGIWNENSNNFLGIAGMWTKTSHPSLGDNGRNETGIEINYTIQITPTVVCQPNFQMIFDPVSNPRSNYASVFQFQITSTW